MSTYTEDLEKRIEQLEDINEKYRSIAVTLDKIKELHVSYTSAQELVTVKGVLGYMQTHGKVLRVDKSARYVKVLYETPFSDITNAHFNHIIHYAKDKGSENEQLMGCLQIFKTMWMSNLTSKIQLLTDIIEAEYDYDPFYYGRI